MRIRPQRSGAESPIAPNMLLYFSRLRSEHEKFAGMTTYVLQFLLHSHQETATDLAVIFLHELSSRRPYQLGSFHLLRCKETRDQAVEYLLGKFKDALKTICPKLRVSDERKLIFSSGLYEESFRKRIEECIVARYQELIEAAKNNREPRLVPQTSIEFSDDSSSSSTSERSCIIV